MTRYEIALGKIPPPVKEPPKAKEKPQAKKNTKKVSSDETSNRQREEILRTFLQTFEGRQRLAASLASPMRQRLNQRSLARRIFRVDDLTVFPGRPVPPPLYDKELAQEAYYINADGQSIGTVGTDQDRVLVPEFEIGANTSIPVRVLRNPLYAVERAQDYIFQQFRANEQSVAFELLNSAANKERNVNVSSLDFSVLMDAFAAIESHDLRVANIFMTAHDYSILRRVNRGNLDIETNRELLVTGMMATLFGAQIYLDRMIPQGKIYVTAEPEFVGIMPIMQDITVISADDPAERAIGWQFSERVGMCLINPPAVMSITTSDYTGN